MVNFVKTSSRGEKEITDVLIHYLQNESLLYENLSRGVFWLDAGTVENLLEASQFVSVVQARQGQLIGSPDEAALRMNFISELEFKNLVENLKESSYKDQVSRIIV